MIVLIRFVVHTMMDRPGERALGAELHVARPPLLVRRWRAIGRKGKILLLFDSRETASRGMAHFRIGFSEAEAKANSGIDRVAMEEAVLQAAIDL